MNRATLFIDFDGTISPVDISNTFFSTFAGEDAVAAVEDWKKGLISSCDCLKRELDAYLGNLQDLKAFAEGQPIDRGFFELQKECENRGIDMLVVSDGLYFYIEPFLQAHRARVYFYSNRLEIRDGERALAFPHYRESCGRCANCKSSHVEREKQKGKAIIYVGDGLSDKCAVSKADLVFAKGDLETFCERESIPYLKFETLSQVADHLKSIRLDNLRDQGQ